MRLPRQTPLGLGFDARQTWLHASPQAAGWPAGRTYAVSLCLASPLAVMAGIGAPGGSLACLGGGGAEVQNPWSPRGALPLGDAGLGPPAWPRMRVPPPSMHSERCIITPGSVAPAVEALPTRSPGDHFTGWWAGVSRSPSTNPATAPKPVQTFVYNRDNNFSHYHTTIPVDPRRQPNLTDCGTAGSPQLRGSSVLHWYTET